MIPAFRSEWSKTLRKGMVLGGLGIMVAFALLAVTVRFANAQEGAPEGEGEPQVRGPPIFSLSELAKPRGMVVAFSGFAGNLVGVVSLVLFAQSVGVEYGWGTVRVMLAREPRRLRLLAGKLAAMAAFVTMGVAAAWVAQSVAAVLGAAVRNVDTQAWWTAEGMRESVGAFLRVAFTATVWGLMGAALAMALRSAAPAIGAGIGYALVAENLLILAWDEGEKWLPGQLLGQFNLGTGEPVALPVAGLLLAFYGAAFAVACGAVFLRRDVTA